MKRTAFLENCDPRLKLLLALEFALCVATTYSWLVLAGAALLILVWLFCSQVDLGQALRRLLAANLFLFFVLLTLPFSTPGQVLWAWGPLEVSREGLTLALLICLKSNLILCSSLLLLGTSSIFALAHALHHLKVPSNLVQLIFFTARYLELLKRQYRLLREALALRGFVPRTNLHTYRTLAYLVGTLLIRSYDQAQRVFEAMLCRGFKGTFPVYHHFALRRRDLLFALSSGIYLFLVALLGGLG